MKPACSFVFPTARVPEALSQHFLKSYNMKTNGPISPNNIMALLYSVNFEVAATHVQLNSDFFMLCWLRVESVAFS